MLAALCHLLLWPGPCQADECVPQPLAFHLYCGELKGCCLLTQDLWWVTISESECTHTFIVLADSVIAVAVLALFQ